MKTYKTLTGYTATITHYDPDTMLHHGHIMTSNFARPVCPKTTWDNMGCNPDNFFYSISFDEKSMWERFNALTRDQQADLIYNQFKPEVNPYDQAQAFYYYEERNTSRNIMHMILLILGLWFLILYALIA